MLRSILAVAATSILLVACGSGDTDTPAEGPVVAAPDSPANPAIDTEDTSEKSALTAGANSFTEGQAREAIEKQGYTVTGPLTQDSQGIWSGQAARGSSAVSTVSVDYKGVVSPT